MKYADSHMHLFAPGFPGNYGSWFPKGGELRAYEAIRSVHPIERSLVVGYERDPWAKGNNQYILKLSQTRPWMAPLAYCSTAKQVTAMQLNRYWQSGFYGISLYLVESSDVANVLAWPEKACQVLNDQKAIISINVPMRHLRDLRPFFERLPKASILISHLGLPGQLEGNVRPNQAHKVLQPLLQHADLSQIGVKISAFYAFGRYPHSYIKPFVKCIYDAFGGKRLCWGSDFVPVLDYESYPQSISSVEAAIDGFPIADQKAIFHGNLLRLMQRVNRVSCSTLPAE